MKAITDYESALEDATQRRSRLAERLAEIDAPLSATRADHVSAVAGGGSVDHATITEIRSLDDERAVLAAAIEQVDAELAGINAELAPARAKFALAAAEDSVRACTEAAVAARDARRERIHRFLAEELPPLNAAVKVAQERGRSAVGALHTAAAHAAALQAGPGPAHFGNWSVDEHRSAREANLVLLLSQCAVEISAGNAW